MKNSLFRTALAAAALISLCTASAQAQTYFWDPSDNGTGSQTDGNGTWDSGAPTGKFDWTDGTTPTQWPNSNTDIAEFGMPTNTFAGGATVTLNATVNAGGLFFNNAIPGSINTGTTVYNLTGTGTGTINDAGGIFTIATPTVFFTDVSITNINFKGASEYLFTGGTNPSNRPGENLSGNDFFDNNVVLGTGNANDNGSLSYSTGGNATGGAITSSSNSITINKGWSLIDRSGTSTITQNVILNGLGNAGQGTLVFGPATNDVWKGNITLQSDSSIVGRPNLGTTITSNISGTGNLYLGYDTVGTPTATTGLVISGTNTYTGQTIIINATSTNGSQLLNNNLGTGNTADNLTADGGITGAAVKIGENNALPTGTTLVLGTTHTTATTTGAGTIASTDSLIGSGTQLASSDGAFDLNGFNQSVAGLAVGGAQFASSQFIGNNSNAGVSTLTVNGSTTPTTGFAGVIEDNFAAQQTITGKSGGTVAFAVANGGKINITGGLNTYSGGTTVSGTGSTLLVNNASGSATGTGAVTVSTGGIIGGGTTAATAGATLSKLGGTGHVPTLSTYNSLVGKIGGALTIQSGGHLAPGNSVGTITTASLTLQSGGLADYEFNSTANDFTIVSGNLELDSGSLINLVQEGTSTAFDTVGVYDLFSYGTLVGPIGLTVGNQQAGFSYSIVDDAADHLIQLDITTASIPEPSTWALLLGGVALLVIYQRRTRRSNS